MLGVFDSGCGGLTVLRTIRDRIPHGSILYLGDSARLPYGERSREEVTRFTQECCQALFDRGCTLIILACNTASADTLRTLQQEWLPTLQGKPKNILGVIRPLAEEAVLRTKSKRIAVVGTRSTIASGAYERELKKLDPAITVLQQACPLLVPLVEEGFLEKPETKKILRTYLQRIKSCNPDVLILGCTHYEVLHHLFQRKMGARCTVLHSPGIVATKLTEYLARHPEYEEAISGTRGETLCLTTGDPDRFREMGSRFYGREIPHVERITL